MNKIIKFALLATILTAFCTNAHAYYYDKAGKTKIWETDTVSGTTYTFKSRYDGDISDLQHGKYYTWGIDVGEDFLDGKSITGAEISFKNIYNWRDEAYDLWVALLDNPPTGVIENSDTLFGNSYPDHRNEFENEEQLAHFSSTGADDGVLPTNYNDATNVTISFNLVDDKLFLDKLAQYLDDGVYGLGFDPDCHFYNRGVKFSIMTSEASNNSEVPEPATMLLFGTGLIGLALGARRKRNKK